MAVYNSKDKLAYFKDNKQTQDNSDDFDITKYYYNREGITSNTPPIPSSSSSSSSSSSLSSNSLLSSSNSLNEQQLLQQQQQLSHNANLTHQQRIPMTQMAGRSQSGGNPGMQISGDSHYTGVPQISRSATTPYASGPSMNMYHQMPNRISEINGNGPAQQMPYNLPRSAHDGNIQYDNNNFPGLPSQLRYPLNSMGQQSQQHSQQQTQTLQHHHQQQQQQHQQHSSIGNIQQNRSDEEFTIHNEEDFPALPGSSQHKLGGNRNDHSTEDNNNNNNNNNSTTANNNNNNSNNNNNNNQYDQLPNGNAFGSNMSNIRQVSNQQQFAQQLSSNTISGNNSFVGSNQPNHPPSPGLYSSSSNVPPNRLLLPRTVTSPKLQPVSSDGNSTKPEAKFGLLGLIDVIRLTDRDLNILALGSDLTAIGLNLNSADCLYASFSSPFADHTISTEPNFSTPSCYLMHPPNLKAEHLNKFLPETLFYMFYAMPRDGFQMTAAQELYRREWKYHGELKIWLKSRSPQELMQSHPSIQYIYFDPSSWEIRLFSGPSRIPIATGFLSDEEIRGKIQQIAGNAPSPSVTIPGMTGT